MESGLQRPELQVCDVRGAYLSRLDNDRRLADHFYGKMHHGSIPGHCREVDRREARMLCLRLDLATGSGYAQMRKSYESLQKELLGTG